MAQKVILKHGVNEPPSGGTYSKGELLIRHASESKDVALYTVNNSNVLESFPSKTYVDEQIDNVTNIANNSNTTISTGTTGNVKVELTSTGGSKTYQISGVNLATKGDIPSITTGTTSGISVTKTGNSYTISSSGLVSKLELESVEDKAQSALDSIDAILNGSGSTEAIDTLKDVIVWINDHEDVKTSILTAITEHTEILSGFTKTSTVKGTTNALQASIESLEDLIDGIDRDFIKQIKIKEVKNGTITESFKSGSTVSLLEMVIDCGEY